MNEIRIKAWYKMASFRIKYTYFNDVRKRALKNYNNLSKRTIDL